MLPYILAGEKEGGSISMSAGHARSGEDNTRRFSAALVCQLTEYVALLAYSFALLVKQWKDDPLPGLAARCCAETFFEAGKVAV